MATLWIVFLNIKENNMKQLYKHQLEAFEKFKDKDDIMLFFEQGCGKSATALRIAQYKYEQGIIDQLLIIAPNDVHYQWATEQVPEWLDCDYTVLCFAGRGGVGKFYSPTVANKLGIVCVNIDTFSQPTKWKDVVAWTCNKKTMIVLDEATAIKTVDSKRTQNILCEFNDIHKMGRRMINSTKKSNCKVRCVLTGTPVTNGPLDLWSIAEFVKPNFFGLNWWSFKNYYGMFTRLTVNNRDVPILLNEKAWKGIKACESYALAYNIFGCSEDTYFTIQSQPKYCGPYKHAEELKDKLQSVAIFKKITECLDMPEKTYVKRTLKMNAEQQRAYKTMKDQQIAEYKDHVVTALNKLTMATRLQQISSGFICNKIDKESLEGLPEDIMPEEVVWLGNSNPKLDYLMRDVDEADKPCIILTRFSAEAAKIYDMLKDKYTTLLYTGWKKTGKLEDFKTGNYDVIVANTACIARGFNLQNSHTILYYSNTFSMELREQSEARTFRSGQKNECIYIDYVFENTIDEAILKALRTKKGMLEYFRDTDSKAYIGV